ncbi:MAG: TIR domain-containing protein [Spirochaetota bacterium]
MARKTFISYKYSEARNLRDAIIVKLGNDATFYQGETSESPDLTDVNAETIKKKLCDMMYNTTVTIVVISPNMKQSKWIDWEIEYCLKEITREGRTSTTNGLVGVIQKVDGGYDWFRTFNENYDGCITRIFNNSLVYDIILKNRFNQKPKKYACVNCKCYEELTASYISYVEEEEFLSNPQVYIENAFNKSEEIDGYDLVKQR